MYIYAQVLGSNIRWMFVTHINTSHALIKSAFYFSFHSFLYFFYISLISGGGTKRSLKKRVMCFELEQIKQRQVTEEILCIYK